VDVNKPLKSCGYLRYDYGKLFIRNSETKTIDCYSVQGGVKYIRKLWSIPAKPRWTDETIVLDAKHQQFFQPNLIVLRENSRLERFSLQTGVLLETIHLYKDVKFTEIAEDLERNWLVLKSTNQSIRLPGSRATGKVLLRFLIFERAPLKVLHHIEIRRSCKAKDVSISNGLLMVLGEKGMIRLYSIDDVIRNIDNVVVNKVDGHLVNIQVSEFGDCLFELSSHHHYLEINQNYKIYIKAESEVEFSVGRLVDNYILGQESCSANLNHEPDAISFMPDDTGRIMKYGSSGLKIYQPPSSYSFSNSIRSESSQPDGKVLNQLLDTNKLGLVFDLWKVKDDGMGKENSSSGFSRSGRRVNRTQSYQELSTESVSVNLEDELDILGVLITSQIEEDIVHAKEIKLLDSRTLTELRTIPLDLYDSRPGVCMSSEFSLVLDLDTLIVTVKSGSKTTSHIYRLMEITEKSQKN